jgi:hypothetical protein
MRAGGRHFRPCGRDRLEFFNSTGWALHVNVAGPCPKSPIPFVSVIAYGC